VLEQGKERGGANAVLAFFIRVIREIRGFKSLISRFGSQAWKWVTFASKSEMVFVRNILMCK
jgi:hypothetical protein